MFEARIILINVFVNQKMWETALDNADTFLLEYPTSSYRRLESFVVDPSNRKCSPVTGTSAMLRHMMSAEAALLFFSMPAIQFREAPGKR